MSWETLKNAIRSRFEDQVGEPQGATVLYDNEFEQTPSTGVWMVVTIQTGETQQADLGPVPRYRTAGQIVVEIYQEAAEGDYTTTALADEVARAFRSLTADGVTYRSPSLTQLGRSGKWWQQNVSCPFYYDEIPTEG